MLAMQAFAAKRIEPTPCQTQMRATERFSEEPTVTKLEKVLYTAKAHTTGGRDGASRSDDGRLEVKLSSPGAPQGIGAGIARAFLDRGYRVVANSRRVTTSGAFSPADNLALVDGDIADPQTATRIAETAIGRFGSIDALVNNAGIFFTKRLTDYTTEDFRSLVKKLSPMGRVSTVNEIADAVLYLTEAQSVTGEVLHVDGGAHRGKW